MELKADPQNDDLIVWVILSKGAASRLEKMVGNRILPVLADTPAADVQRLYGFSKAASHRVFGPDGCLSEVELQHSTSLQNNPKLLLPALVGER